MSFNREQYLVKPHNNFKLSDHDPSDKSQVPQSKKERLSYVESLSPELATHQVRLFAEQKRKVLIILQGMDTSGKDGTIRRVFQSVNPIGLRVAYFKAPTENELARDYLWRVHQVVPKTGEIVIFNRSHYEDVLTVPVHNWITPKQEAQRLHHITEFERLLAETGTTIIKLFLNISKDEQRERLQERIDNPEKNWKFNPGDLADRQLWDKFQAQYEKVIAATSRDYAPWYIIPANSKSTRDAVVTNILLQHLEEMQLEFPTVDTSDWPKTVER